MVLPIVRSVEVLPPSACPPGRFSPSLRVVEIDAGGERLTATVTEVKKLSNPVAPVPSSAPLTAGPSSPSAKRRATRAVLNRICAIFCSSAWRLGGTTAGVCATVHAGTASTPTTTTATQPAAIQHAEAGGNSSPASSAQHTLAAGFTVSIPRCFGYAPCVLARVSSSENIRSSVVAGNGLAG